MSSPFLLFVTIPTSSDIFDPQSQAPCGLSLPWSAELVWGCSTPGLEAGSSQQVVFLPKAYAA